MEQGTQRQPGQPVKVRLHGRVREPAAQYILSKYNVMVDDSMSEEYIECPVVALEDMLAQMRMEKRVGLSGSKMIKLIAPENRLDGVSGVWHQQVDADPFAPLPEVGCRCPFGQCGHLADSAIISSCSKYLNPASLKDVLDGTVARRGLVAVYSYEGVGGSYTNKEVEWHRFDAKKVHVECGAGIRLNYPPQDWMEVGHFFFHDEGLVLRSQFIETVGDLQIHAIWISDIIEEVPQYTEVSVWTPEIISSEVRPNVLYSLVANQDRPNSALSLNFAKFGFSHLYALPGIYVIGGRETKDVILSSAILWKTNRWYMNKPRDADLLKSITRFVQGEYARIANVPEDVKYRAQLVTVALVMSMNIREEASVLADLTYSMSTMWQVHAATTRLEPVASYTVADILVRGFFITTGAATIKPLMSAVHLPALSLPPSAAFVTKVVGHTAVMKVAAVATTAASAPSMPLALPLFVLATGALCVQELRRREVFGPRSPPELKWVKTDAGEAPPSTNQPLTYLKSVIKYGPTYRVTEEKEVGVGRVGPVPNLPPKRETRKMELRGIVFDGTMPTYHATTGSNERLALVNRLTNSAKPVPGLFEQIAALHLKYPHRVKICENLSCTVLKLTRSTVLQYVSKFPRHQQFELLRGYEKFLAQDQHLLPNDYVTSMFGKIEKAVKQVIENGEVVADENEPSTMRAIISMKPILSVTYGTIIAQYAAIKKKVYTGLMDDGSACPVCPKGVSAETRTQWFEYWYDVFGEDVVYAAFDKKQFDGSQSAESFDAAYAVSLNNARVIPSHMVEEFRNSHRVIRGKSKGGVVYELEDKMGSGSSATSDIGSEVNEIGTTFAMSPYSAENVLSIENLSSGLGRNFAIAIEGDDDFVMMSGKWFRETYSSLDPYDECYQRTKSRWAMLGFEITGRVSRELWDVDYLSKLWYPTPDGHILGGKIGRVLSRAGWFLNVKDEQTIRQAASSALHDNYHVPFLRQYFQRVMDLTRGQSMKGRTVEYTVHTEFRHEYDEVTLKFVERRYGLTEKDLLEFSELLDKITSLPVIVNWKHYLRCVEIDNA